MGQLLHSIQLAAKEEERAVARAAASFNGNKGRLKRMSLHYPVSDLRSTSTNGDEEEMQDSDESEDGVVEVAEFFDSSSSWVIRGPNNSFYVSSRHPSVGAIANEQAFVRDLATGRLELVEPNDYYYSDEDFEDEEEMKPGHAQEEDISESEELGEEEEEGSELSAEESDDSDPE
ncbi:hypothetical protein C8J55DRAFT_562925 [Lentinula edodes]|uniref:Uncharacterized protein n=1 Tax=Lentinula lateritia TaxID=40482 RepID=A0A9W9A3P1_9AGAR|nr:hypothetical protein C8J55DRAFT_562925 [Lentinula edodes]